MIIHICTYYARIQQIESKQNKCLHYNKSRREITMDIEQQSQYLLNPNKLLSQFTCTICLGQIQDCYITRCGHVYCKKCIQQSVNRHHRCPFCNQDIKEFSVDVFKNYHFNAIKKIVEDQRKRWEQGYMKKVWKKYEEQGIQVQEGQKELMQPIQNKIIDECKKVLLKYRVYLLDLYRSQQQAEQRKLLNGSKLVRNHKQIIDSIQQQVLSNFPAPVVAPQLIKVATGLQLVMPGNKSHKSVIRLSPASTLGSILPHLHTVCSEMNMRMNGEMPKMLKINGENMLLEQRLGQKVGHNLKIEGMPFQTNIYCYSYKWQNGKQTDFYTCKQCAVKWICENCALHCHNGHTIILQLKDHKANWACCYCVTKCDCKAINKNSA